MRPTFLRDQRGGGSAHCAVQLTAEVSVARARRPLAATARERGWLGMRLGSVLIAVAGTGTGRGQGAGVRSVHGSGVWHLVRGDGLWAMVGLGHPETLPASKDNLLKLGSSFF